VVAHNAIPIILRLIQGCNRSDPHTKLMKKALDILANLAQFDRTALALFNCTGSVDTLLDLMQRNYEKQKDIFLQAVQVLLSLIRTHQSLAARLASIPKLLPRLQMIESALVRKQGLPSTTAKLNSSLTASILEQTTLANSKFKSLMAHLKNVK
jgi:hypothetical protein